jgi:hypothetical protein
MTISRALLRFYLSSLCDNHLHEKRKIQKTFRSPPKKKLFTCFIEDIDIGSPGGGSFFHYLVVNARGCDSTSGTEIIEFLPEFALAVDFSTTPLATILDPAPAGLSHRHVHQCYEQTRPVQSGEWQSAKGCDTAARSQAVVIYIIILNQIVARKKTCVLTISYLPLSDHSSRLG